MVYSIDILMQKILDGDKQYDLNKIVKSYEFSAEAHKEQKRDSGEPYIIHPLAVSFILLELGMDTDTICAAMLHDVVEDTDTSLDELKKLFGEDVAMLVDGVTKIGKIPLYTKEEQQAENVRKILLAMSQDIRVIIIKLADRLHNMRTLNHRPANKQRATALETMNIYAPIAHRLGIRAIKDELEDLAFHYLDPFAYREIEQVMEKRRGDRQMFIESIQQRIRMRLEEVDYTKKPQIDGRVKSIYGIYKKVYMTQRGFDEIYDKYAIRIIVSTVFECYNTLGIIHDMFKPIPNRFKDYISTPKANMYQSLHTTVIGREGIPFEVQIRTWDMHYTAEYGIAAHWKYKEGIQGKDRFENRLAWIRQIIEAQQETNDVEEIVRTIKSDLATDDVFAFSPKGDMITLPLGATVIDFAYAIHTQVGHKMTGAKVDGKLVPMEYKLKTGEIVEIILSKDEGKGPNRTWLDIVKTNEAKSKIRTWFKKECREENIVNGKAELEREFKRNLIHVPESDMEEFLADDMHRHNCETLDDFYAAIGYGGILLSKMLQRMKDNYIRRYVDTEKEAPSLEPTKQKSTDGIIVEGIENCLIKFSQCCNPLPGDNVIGFITRGHGISIHKTDCVNYQNAVRDNKEMERWVNVSWEDNNTKAYRATLDIVSYDRKGLLADVAILLSENRIFIHESTSRELKNGNADISVTISVGGIEQLNNVIAKLKKIQGVVSVTRSGK
ncbi:MAG: bifunctional (p)ppGpp synthetase/guanosine-3',5'-bis(diphosphate) 3'-pyrophosphohydrolase [Ruminococcus sp.]|nr:bifunctional (p)ppGpp synthetase/guanosine-3',5'-bis(diphosphate) 3'-pyrophosphohydrolase [Ruminococcus sp.]